MKRVLVLLLVALLAAGGWLLARHRGDAAAAWTEAREVAPSLPGLAVARATALAGALAGRGGEAKPAASGPGRVGVVTVAAESVELPVTRAAVGWLEPVASVVLRARMDGQIVEQVVQDGQVVNAGDVLFRLDDREVRASLARTEAALIKDRAMLAKSEADVRRVGELLSKNAASQQQFDVVSADAKVNAANVQADQAAIEADKVRIDYTTIRAPITGRIGTVRATTGNLVKGNESAGDGLATITQMKPLRAAFAMPEADLDLLRAALARPSGAAVRVYASGTERVLASGRLIFVDSAVDQASGTVTARALFGNEDERLWPGQYVRVEVDLSVRPNTVTVPLVAVQPGQDGSYAYVIRDGGKDGGKGLRAERRRVELVEARGNTAAIAKGIAAGERVVVEGQLRLRDGIPVEERVVPPASAPQARTAQAG